MHHGMFKSQADLAVAVPSPAQGDTAIPGLIVKEWTGTDWVGITGNIDSDNNAPPVFAFDDDGYGVSDLGSAFNNSTLDDEM
jgi:hypothetical protein